MRHLLLWMRGRGIRERGARREISFGGRVLKREVGKSGWCEGDAGINVFIISWG